jgi:hypothetical protein
MEFECRLPFPFLFNGLKHHRQIIVEFIEKSIAENRSVSDLNVRIVKLGNSMIDLYYGDLTALEIANDIMGVLKMENRFNKAEYHKHIVESPKKYRTVQISDGSDWTLLLGKEENRFIHIHPSRGSKFTLRVKAISIKTALMLKVFFAREVQCNELVSLVNTVRLDYLSESPIKNELDTTRIKKVLDLL